MVLTIADFICDNLFRMCRFLHTLIRVWIQTIARTTTVRNKYDKMTCDVVIKVVHKL